MEHSKCLFLLKWPKYPWLALGSIKGQTWSELSQNNIFHSFTSNLSFSEIFNKLWPSLTWSQSRVGPKTLILIRLPERVETNAIVNIIEFSFQRLFMGLKLELEQPRYHENRNDALIDALQTFESHNFWCDCWIFEFHTFLEIENQDLSKGVKIIPIRGGLRPVAIERPPAAL